MLGYESFGGGWIYMEQMLFSGGGCCRRCGGLVLS